MNLVTDDSLPFVWVLRKTIAVTRSFARIVRPGQFNGTEKIALLDEGQDPVGPSK
jgi:hypothetical protein